MEKSRSLATFCALSVFPLGLNPLLEEMEVSPHDQPARCQYIIIEAPKVFHGIERVDGSQSLSPCRLLLASVRVVEPELPGVLKWMFKAEVR